jgi:predicted ATPase
LDDATAGLDLVEEAVSCSRETNERWWDAELHRLRAELLLCGGAVFTESLATPDLQSARALLSRLV